LNGFFGSFHRNRTKIGNPIIARKRNYAMCFSASASFIAGATLTVAGVATLRLVTRPSQIPFALIPLLFGIQQIIEGLIWLSLANRSKIDNASLTLMYSVFSHVLWPVFMPFAVSLLETVPWRRKALAVCQVAGLAVGLYLLYFLLQYPVVSRVLGKHIVYESPHFYIVEVMFLYLISTCVSSMLSSNNIIRVFGVLALATFLGAYAIHVATMVSVWCFFAAVLSFIIYLYFRQERTEPSRGTHTTLRARFDAAEAP
jgi:hypothetical protein